MTKKKVDKTELKRHAWLERTTLVLGVSEEETRQLLSLERRQSLRINPLQGKPEQTLAELRKLGWEGDSYGWMSNGYTLGTELEAVRDSELVAEGRVFIQNAASWLPVLALDPQPGEAILDVCAAPGGKTSHIAALTDNKAGITANDNSRPRLLRLQQNMQRLGVQISEYTLYDATRLTTKLEGQQFDKILLDAPCSGEGLMNLNRDKDFASWSVAHIKRLQQLQKRILTQAWQLLSPGGTLVYSTCTMAPEEDEAVVDYLLRTHEDARLTPFDVKLPNRATVLTAWNDKAFTHDLSGCLRLAPSEDIEAFFVAKLQKSAE